MTKYEAHWLWYDFANIAGSAVMRSQNVDANDPHIDWHRQDQAIRLAGLSFACSIFEELGLKGANDHITTLFHLRNAMLHNSSDIKLNRGHPNPFNECIQYLSNEIWKQVISVYSEREKPHFILNGNGTVSIEASIFRFVERLLDTFLTEQERKTPPPKIR